MQANQSNHCMEVDSDEETSCPAQGQSNSSSSDAQVKLVATSPGKGKGRGPPPPAAKGKGVKGPPPHHTNGKGKGYGPPAAKAKGKGKCWPWPQDISEVQTPEEGVLEGQPVCIVGRLMDGRELDLQLRTSEKGLALKQQISEELGISTSRLRLVVGAQLFGDLTTLDAMGIADGAAINIIILSPLQGSLTRSGLDVPVDILEMKIELHDALEARGCLIQPVS